MWWPEGYTPPGPAFTTCVCGALVLEHVWMSGTKARPAHWRALPQPISPVCGWIHQCLGDTPPPLRERKDGAATSTPVGKAVSIADFRDDSRTEVC